MDLATIVSDLSKERDRLSRAITALIKSASSVWSPSGKKRLGRPKSSATKKRKRGGQVDMDKLADGLVKLPEDDLLQVVQMIHDNKNEETYTKNDIESKSTLL